MTNKIEKLNPSRDSNYYFNRFLLNDIEVNNTIDCLQTICKKIDEIIDFVNENKIPKDKSKT